MNEQNGTLCLIYKGEAGTEVLVGQSIMNITYGGNPIDISSKSDSDWANLLNDEITAQQITIAGALTYNSDFTFESVKADAETGQHDKYIFRFGLTGDRVEGYFIPVNVTDSTTGGERVSTNVSFNSSDQVLSGGSAGPVSIVGSVDPFGDGSLVLKLQLDDDLAQTKGNFDVTEYGGLSTFSPARFNNGLVTQEGKEIGINCEIGSAFTISFFGKVNTVDSTSGVIFSAGWGNGLDRLAIKADADNHGKVLSINAGSDSTWRSTRIDFSNLSFMAVTYTGERIAIYNGESGQPLFEFATTLNITTGIVLGGFYLPGHGSYLPSQGVDGLIDQLEIYNRALTESEVGNLYTQTIQV